MELHNVISGSFDSPENATAMLTIDATIEGVREEMPFALVPGDRAPMYGLIVQWLADNPNFVIGPYVEPVADE